MDKDSLGQNRLRFHSTLECTCLKDANHCKSELSVKHEQLKTPFCHFYLIQLLKTNFVNNKEDYCFSETHET